MADSSKHSEASQPSLNQVDNLLRLRTVRWRWIFAIWTLEWIAFSVLLLLGHNAPVPFVIFMALFGGWQLGCASERNDWHTAVSDLVATDKDVK